MPKRQLKPDAFLYPVPAVLVSTAGKDGRPNVATFAWTGILCSDPPYVYVSIRPSRLTFDNITETGEFVINIVGNEHLEALDYCGIVSGRSEDKFAATGLTTQPATIVKAPLIAEARVNLECEVKQVLPLGTHHTFVAQVVATHADEEVLDGGKIDHNRLEPVAYIPHGYYGISGSIGRYGFSKKK